MNFVINRDKKDLFRFAAFQSDQSKEILKKINFGASTSETFVLIVGDSYFTKSTAALMVCKELKSPIRFLFPLIFIPKFLRDFTYDLIAKNRYTIFGKKETCSLPDEEDKIKFII